MSGKVIDIKPKAEEKKLPQSVFSMKCEGYMHILTIIVGNSKCDFDQKIQLIEKLNIIEKVKKIKIIGDHSKKIAVKKNYMYISATDIKEAAKKFLTNLIELSNRK